MKHRHNTQCGLYLFLTTTLRAKDACDKEVPVTKNLWLWPRYIPIISMVDTHQTRPDRPKRQEKLTSANKHLSKRTLRSAQHGRQVWIRTQHKLQICWKASKSKYDSDDDKLCICGYKYNKTNNNNEIKELIHVYICMAFVCVLLS